MYMLMLFVIVDNDGMVLKDFDIPSGINNRFYAGYKPEDFIGKIATVCQAGNNCNVEYVAMKRFYLASLVLCF